MAFFALIGTIATWILSGMVAWDWVKPDSFGGALLFLFAWAILGKVFDFIFGMITLAIAKGLS